MDRVIVVATVIALAWLRSRRNWVDGYDVHVCLLGQSHDWQRQPQQLSAGVLSYIPNTTLERDRARDQYKNGTEEDDIILAGVGADDGSVIIAGYTWGSYGAVNAGEDDFVAMKIDSDGNTMWQWQNGTDSWDEVRALTMGDDGSIVLVGYTNGNWSTTNAGDFDCVAIKLDADGTMAWTWQGGTEEDVYCKGVAMADDGSVIVAGDSYGDWRGVNAGENDFVAVKLDAAGEQVWVWQASHDGTDTNDYVNIVLAIGNGSAVLAGNTYGSWGGTNAGLNDFLAVKLDANRTVDWKWQEGSSDMEAIIGATALNGGSVVLAGFSSGNWSRTNNGTNDFAAVELYANGTVLWRWQNGTADFDRLYAAATDGDGRVLLVGFTKGNWSGVNAGDEDFAAILLERPTTAPSPITPVPSLPPRAPTLPSTPSHTTEQPTTAPSPTNPSPSVPVSPPTSSLPPSSSPPQSLPSAAGTPGPSSTGSAGSSSSTSMATVAGTVAAVVAVVILLLIVWIWRRNTRRKDEGSQFPRSVQATPNAPFPDADPSKGNPDGEWGSVNPVHGDAPPTYNSVSIHGGLPVVGERMPAPIAPPTVAIESKKPAASAGHGDTSELASDDDQDHVTREKDLIETTSKAKTSALLAALDTDPPPYDPAADQDPNKASESAAEDVTGSTDSRRSGVSSLQLGISAAGAVMEAASAVACSSNIPFVGETAMLVSLLVKLVVDYSSNDAAVDKRVMWCRSIVSILKRASELLGKGDDDTIGDAERCMLEDVHNSVNDLVGILQTYKAKGKISKLFVSSLFKHRQEEAEAVINHAISSLQLGLQVQSGHDLASVGQQVHNIKTALETLAQLPEGLATQFAHQVRVESRREKRQRRLQQLEIPEDQLTLTDVLLGKGGFGEVYLADYSGINAAAKVLQIDPDQQQDSARYEANPVACGAESLRRNASQRKLFLRELQAMTRLKSPHTVHVYGAITCRKDRFVLVMELMPGGDLRTRLREAEERLPETRERGIMRDICFGMAFLHSKGVIHGDLKSANVLFDSAGTAKIADFGSARWTQQSATTGLATTFSITKNNSSTQMSTPWASPEVLDNDGVTFESDVYSFGVIAWEIVSRKMPWANLNARTIFKRVVLAGERPEIPSDTAADVAEFIDSCWQDNPRERPKFTEILDSVKSWPK